MEKRRRIAIKGKSNSSVPLKQRLLDHRKNIGNVEPKDSTMTCLAVSFTWGNTFILLVEGFAVVLPSYHITSHINQNGVKTMEYGNGFIWAFIASAWLLLETFYHWWFLRDGQSNVVKKTTKEEYFKTLRTGTPSGWKRCSVCKLDAPPRSHHCKTCNKCILKRDHHCYFSGSCVGFHNQRHFIFFLIYVSITCAYAICMQIIYLSKEHPLYFIPVVAMWKTVTGQSRQLCLLILVHMYISVISLFGAVSFLAWQLGVIYRGQTSYEATRNISTYRKKPVENLRAVFGSPLQCFLSFIFPFRLGLPNDGISWT